MSLAVLKINRIAGCCYAFATASVLESLYAIKSKSKTVVELSPQQITDCSINGNSGCNGGNFPPSVRYVKGQGGRLATLASYPYAGKKQTCRTSGLDQVNLGTVDYHAIPEGDEKAMAQALAQFGPIFIGLDADSKAVHVLQVRRAQHRQLSDASARHGSRHGGRRLRLRQRAEDVLLDREEFLGREVG